MMDEDRLERLISAHFDGELAVEERAELEGMLFSSAKAREIFLTYADLHGLLRETTLRADGAYWLEGAAPSRKRVHWLWMAAGLAACGALGVWLFPRSVEPRLAVADPISVVREHVALLGMAIDVEWVGPSFAAGEALPKGLLNIRKGTLRLDFYSGARVVLEGPARLELISADLARLDEGRLRAEVPPPAEGFTILSGDLRVVDRGTQFGMSVEGEDDCTVHVFDGEVELQGELPEATARQLFEGDGISIRAGISTVIAADRGLFADPTRLSEAAEQEAEAKWEEWQEKSEALRSAPGLLVYYDFQELDLVTMIVRNRAAGAGEGSNGSVIGCEPLSGRWNRQVALGFAKTSDRVRFRTEGHSVSATLMAWVRVDSLPLDHNSLLSMAPGEVGEVHWKLDQSGRMLFGLRAAPELDYHSWERLESPQVVTPEDFGRWMHLATVIDGEGGEMRHYVNGIEVAKAALKRKVPVRLGLSNLGNFDSVTADTGFVRNFNGRIDGFALFTRALAAEEIKAAL